MFKKKKFLSRDEQQAILIVARQELRRSDAGPTIRADAESAMRKIKELYD